MFLRKVSAETPQHVEQALAEFYPFTASAKRPRSPLLGFCCGVEMGSGAMGRWVRRHKGTFGPTGGCINDTLHRAAVEDITGQSTLPAHRLEEQLGEITEKLDEMSRPLWRRFFVIRKPKL